MGARVSDRSHTESGWYNVGSTRMAGTDSAMESEPGTAREAPPLKLNALQSAMFPDIAMILALIVLFYALLAHGGPQNLLRDTDAGWHILTGEKILASGELPRTDSYSFSKPGGAWFAWEWLADIGMGWTHSHFGLRGVVFLTSLILALCAWLWVRFSKAVGGDALLAGALMGLTVFCTSIHWLARPHVASWAFLILWLWWMERARERVRVTDVAMGFAFIALWTNIHGSFFLAFPIAGAYALDYWFRDRRRVWWVAAVAAGGLAGTFANPYGWHLHVHLAHYVTGQELLSNVLEFQSFDFSGEGGLIMIGFFLLAGVGAVLSLEQRRWARGLAILLLLTIGLRSVRGIPLVGFAAIPLVNAALTEAMRRYRMFEGFFAESEKFSLFERQTNGALWALLCVPGAWLMLGTPALQGVTRFPEWRLPSKTVAGVAELPRDARLYSSDYFGGYLIYRFRGERKVFIDGRSDYYGLKFAENFIKMERVEPGWREIFRSHHFTHALVGTKAPMLDALEREGWRRMCADEASVLLAPAGATGP